MHLENEKSRLDQDSKKMWDDYKEEETKYHGMNIQTQINEVIMKKLAMEQKYINSPDKSLSTEFKSFT
jgi:hypothetical protein